MVLLCTGDRSGCIMGIAHTEADLLLAYVSASARSHLLTKSTAADVYDVDDDEMGK